MSEKSNVYKSSVRLLKEITINSLLLHQWDVTWLPISKETISSLQLGTIQLPDSTHSKTIMPKSNRYKICKLNLGDYLILICSLYYAKIKLIPWNILFPDRTERYFFCFFWFWDVSLIRLEKVFCLPIAGAFL